MDGTAGMRAWRWILILQGIPSVTIGVLFLFIVPNSVDTARFLNPEERLIMHSMRTRERGQTASAQKFHWVDTKEGLKDPQIWIYCLAQFGEDIMLYGFSIFLPTILMGIGTWTPLQIQALTVPVYALGVITYLAVSRISDKTQQRGVYASLFAVISIIGYAFLLSNRGGTVSYAGCFLVAIGLYVSNGVSVAWLAGNLPRYGKRTLGSAMQLTGGNAAGIFAPFIYPTSGSPRFVTGHAVTLAVVTMSAAIFVGMRFYYVRINKNRAEGKEDWKMEGKTDAEIEEMGDKSPRYIYIV
jgi:sugar phosphate permease